MTDFLGSFSREQMPIMFYLILRVQPATKPKQNEGLTLKSGNEKSSVS